MAPDADKLRQRTSNAPETVSTDDSSLVAKTLKGLKSTEIAIDGKIYDIADFHHPGGETIDLFGGNDVSVQYKMIHPYHTSKHLEKMKLVGTIPDYSTE